MTAPGFRVLTPEEIAKLSPEERVEYRKKLVEQTRGQTAETERTVKARQDRFTRPIQFVAREDRKPFLLLTGDEFHALSPWERAEYLARVEKILEERQRKLLDQVKKGEK